MKTVSSQLFFAITALSLNLNGHHVLSFSPPCCVSSVLGVRSLPRTKGPQFKDTSRQQQKLDRVAHRATSTSVDNSDIISTVSLLVPASSSDQTASKFGSKSPVPHPSYIEAAEQLARKISHFSDGRIIANVVTPPENGQDFLALFPLHLYKCYGYPSGRGPNPFRIKEKQK